MGSNLVEGGEICFEVDTTEKQCPRSYLIANILFICQETSKHRHNGFLSYQPKNVTHVYSVGLVLYRSMNVSICKCKPWY